VRRILGVLALAKKFGLPAVEEAVRDGAVIRSNSVSRGSIQSVIA
jgi:hypothetical protein